MDQERYREAEKLLLDAIALQERRTQTDDDRADLALDYGNYGVLLGLMNRLVEAEAALRKAVALGDAAYPPGHPWAVGLRGDLARILHKRRTWPAERRTLYREAGRAALAELKDDQRRRPRSHRCDARSVHRTGRRRVGSVRPAMRRVSAACTWPPPRFGV